MRTKIGTYRRCLYFNECAKEETYNGEFKESWAKDKERNRWLCWVHYSRFILNKRRHKGFNKKYNDRRIRFLGKRFQLDWNIRTGYCSFCPNNVFDGSCSKTHMHHLLYVPIMIWACTEERCGFCHSIETMKYVRENGLVSGYKKRNQSSGVNIS